MHEDCHKNCVPIEEFEKLQAEVIELRKLVHILMSPYIPSSKKIIKEKKEEPPKEPKKLGAPIGHRGATRKRPEPDEIIDLRNQIPLTSPRYGTDIIDIERFEKIIEDIEIRKIVRKFIGYEVTYESGEVFTTTHPDLPLQGKFGPNISSIWTTMHYIGTLPFDRFSKISRESFGIDITPSGLHNVIYRTSKAFEPTFDAIKENVKNSRYAGSDETRYSDTWLWNIGSEQDTLVLMRPSRGSGVLKEALGETYPGILNSDCFSAYEKYEAKEYQKDWAHITMDAKDLAKHNSEGMYLRKELSRMHKYIDNAKKNKEEGSEKVKFWTWRQKQRMISWMEKKYESKAALNLVRRINKYLDQWFTCLKYDFVESTNNARERDIRKNIIARNVSGCHRSRKGKNAREVMMSTILTAQKRNINPFEFLQNTIKNYNQGIVTLGF